MADPCQPIRNTIDSLRQQIEDIQTSPDYTQGPNDPHPGKPDPEALHEVTVLQKQLASKVAQLHACEQAHVRALALGWPGHVDTDLELSSLLTGNHTLMARFMLQYPNAGQAPIFAAQGGGIFSLVKEDYSNQ